jgi:hypothetical protein
MDQNQKRDLIEYVTNQQITPDGNQRIKDLCVTQKPISTILYRGHKNTPEIKYNQYWYSATKSKRVAKDEFASERCCVFKIHLISIQVIDINVLIGTEIGEYREEEECIFLGGGSFYADKECTTPGFKDNGNGEFECWYKIDTVEEAIDIQRIIKVIPEEEYELIDSPDDIIVDGLTLEQKQLVFAKIQELKEGNKQEAGKTRRIKKQKRQQKRQQKRNKTKRSKTRKSRHRK